jgi:intein/homing endonuclease
MPLTEKEKAARLISKTSNWGGGAGNTMVSGQPNFFSVQQSTDFLELPQSLREKREIYRHFYNCDEIVAQSIDLHTELPMSKVRLAAPKPRTNPPRFKSPEDYGAYILSFFEKMCKRIKLFQRLITATHHYWLDGTCCLFAEDSEVQVPSEIGYDRKVTQKSIVTDDGEAKEVSDAAWLERPNRRDEEFEYYQRHYQGWERLIIFPIDQVQITTFNYTEKTRIELIPSDRDQALIEAAKMGDPSAEEMVEEIPEEVREHIGAGKLIPLGTDPDEGSFCYLLCGRRGAGDEVGQSILDRCHIAGTPVLGKRADMVQQILVEDLDPDTDFVLSHTGAWCEFEIGVRPVSEEITLLHVAKIDTPIGCTKDHKYPVLRGGAVIELDAKGIQPGDYLQVEQIPLSGSLPAGIDLVDFMHDIEGKYKARKSGGESRLRLNVVDSTEDTFTVTYEKEQTDPRQMGRTGDINAILDWASTLSGSVTMRSAEVYERFGLHPVTFKEIRAQLVTLGYGVTLTKGKHIIFPPNLSGLRAPTSAHHTKVFPRTLSLDASFGYFLGFWLGDGHIAKQDGLDYGSIGFTYGPNEPASVNAIEKQIKPLLDTLKVAWSESSTGAGVHLGGHQDALVRWIAMNFGHTSEDKHLPMWVFDANKEFLRGLLRGFCDSDGDVVRKKGGSVSVRFNNTNSLLMEQIFLLCTSLGIPVSKTKPSKERWVKQANGEMAWAKPLYSVYFTHGPSVKTFFESGFLAKRQDPDEWKDGRSGSRHVEHEGKLFYRVSEVSSATHTGPVYSLNVHDDHSFYAAGVRTCNCLRTLYYRDKLRQAQTQIADRAMTPKRIVWADDISLGDVEDLREQVDMALVDPDYSIIVNYEVHWEEMGSKDRLLDLSAEYEQTERRLRTGLGVTESLLSGETLYSGDRLKLEVINQRYLFLREILQEYVEENLFKPVARRKGFVELDEWGEEVVLFPRLSFTRLPLRDSQDTYDALFNLYQKGSISIDLILEMFNIDPHDTRVKIEKDLFTVNDVAFNEMVRGIYGAVGTMLAEKTDIAEKLAKYLGLKLAAAEPEGEPRFLGPPLNREASYHLRLGDDCRPGYPG